MSDHTDHHRFEKSQHNMDCDANSSASPATLIEEDETKSITSSQHNAAKEEKSAPTTSSKVVVETTTSTTASEPAPVSPQRSTKASLSASEVKDIAHKLYQEKFVSISPEEYTQFLAAHDSDSTAIRECYMDLFEWDASLIKATRKLCSKLYLKGESQEIDRLLSAFTKSYLKQHPTNVFCTQDFEQIYIVLYSLILLNTSLHNSEVSKKSKLSQADYIRNTLSTFLSQNKKTSRALSVKQKIQIERELNLYYEDLARNELYLKKGDPDTLKKDSSLNRYSVADTIRSSVSDNHSDYVYEIATASSLANGTVEIVDLSRQRSNTSTWSVDMEGKQRPSLAMKRYTSQASTVSTNSTAVSNLFATGHGAANTPRFGFTRALLSDNNQRGGATGLRHPKSTDHLRTLTRRSSRVSINTKDSAANHRQSDDAYSVVSFGDMPQLNVTNAYGQAQYKLENFDVGDFQDPLDLKLELQGAPYLKEGLLKLRILNNDSADQAAPGEANTSSASSVFSVPTAKTGFFSFFSRSNNKETASASTLGTNSNNVFGAKLTEFFVVVSKGELRLYSFDPKIIKRQQQKLKKEKQQHAFNEFDEAMEDEEDVGDGNWLNNAAHIGNYNLCSTVAQFEKPATHHNAKAAGSQKVMFSLTFPRISKKQPKTFLFEAGTAEIANEFINTCNFWASKLTAVPALEESMSSIEYGWTNLDSLMHMGDTFKKTKCISKWETLPKGVYLSNFCNTELNEGDSASHEGLSKQFFQTLKYYSNLKTLFNSFNRQKSHFMREFRKYSHTSNYKLVMSNYESRSQEYKAELGKYKTYITMLGYALKLRFDLEYEEQMSAWENEIMELPNMDTPEAIAEELSRRKQEVSANESEVTRAVRLELNRLISSSATMKKVIDENMNAESHVESEQTPQQHAPHNSEETNQDSTDDSENPPLVKSPKNFSLSHFKHPVSSPVSQLLSADKSAVVDSREQELNFSPRDLSMSFSTNTIREEDETEELEAHPKVIVA